MSETADDWGVLVNECKAFATSKGAEWWALFDYNYRHTGRIKRLEESISGGLCHVACESEADADELAAHMVEMGIPRTAVKATRLSGYKRTAVTQ